MSSSAPSSTSASGARLERPRAPLRSRGYLARMGSLEFDQINIVVPDVAAAAEFIRNLGGEVPEMRGEWADWADHHAGFPASTSGFDADIDSPAFAAHWGGLPEDFAGVVVNLRAADRDGVDTTCDRARQLGAEVLRPPYDAFWGARYAVVLGPGPLAVGIMSPVSPELRGDSPSVSDFA